MFLSSEHRSDAESFAWHNTSKVFFACVFFLVLLSACSWQERSAVQMIHPYEAEVHKLDSLALVLVENFSSEKYEEVVAQVREIAGADTLSPLYAYGLMYQGWFNASFQRYGQAKTYFIRGFELAAEHDLWQLEVKMGPIAISMFNNLSEEERSGQLYQRLIELRLEHPFDERQQNLFRLAQALWFQSQNQMAEALELYLDIVTYFERINDPFFLSNVYNSIGLVLSLTDNLDEALIWFEKTLEQQYRQRDVQNIARTLNNLGNIYRLQDDHQRAIDSLRSAKAINLQNGRHLSVIRNLYNMGMSYVKLGNWDEALAAFREGYDLSEIHDLTPGLVYNQFGIASVYYERGGQPAQTRELFYEFAEVMDRTGIRVNALATYRILHELEETAGNFDAALRWYKLYHAQVIENDERERRLAIENVLIQNQLEREQAENLFLRETLDLKRQAEYYFILILLILLILIAASVGFVMYYRYSSRELQSANDQLSNQSESIREQNKQLEAFAMERQRLINVIIHDLRNPLSVMESLEDLIDPNDPDSWVEMKEILRMSGEKMRSIVDSLLTVFEAETADIKGEMCEIAIDEVVREVITGYEQLAHKKQMQIKARLDAFTANTHEVTLNRIVSNLVSNAVKYADPETEIFVGLSVNETDWVLTVRDCGQGFDDSEKDKVFSLFAKLSSQPTAGESSVGIGLYSVKTSAERLGGRVELNWDYKQGAEFICTFPLVEVSVAENTLSE